MPADFPATRWSLIARLGDSPAAAAALVETYADAVRRYLRARLAATDADDVTQDVLVHLLEHPEVLARAKPGPGSRFRHYLMTLAWNEARNALRRRRRGGDAQPLAEEPAGAGADPAMDRAWAQSVLTQAWAELRAWADEGQVEPEAVAVGEAVLLRGAQLRETAAALGLPLATCHRRLAAARTLLQRSIADRLRHAGELREGEDAAQAYERLLAELR